MNTNKLPDHRASIEPRALPPSPGTPGEGWDEGDFERRMPLVLWNLPHPDRLPTYREKGPESRGHAQLPSHRAGLLQVKCNQSQRRLH